MEVVRARSFTKQEDLRLSPLKVRGHGASAVAVECLCKGKSDRRVSLQGHFVAKFFKVPTGRAEPPANALHEFEMLQAAKECPHVVQTFGLFHLPPRGSLSQLLTTETLLPHTPAPARCEAVGERRESIGSMGSLSLSDESGKRDSNRICAMLMERCDYSLQDFDFFRYTESEAAFICRSVLTALRHLHALHIIHRDVKPGNILIGDAGEKIVLGDLGLATFLEEERAPSKGCGTHGFLAPECLNEKEFCKASDLFAMGAVLYQLLFRTFAFIKENKAQTDLATCFGDLPLIPCGRPVGKSDEACHLIRCLLEPRACDRPTAASALDHEWFKTTDSSVTLRTFISERHLRNEDDLDTCPMERQCGIQASEQDVQAMASKGLLRGTSSRWGQRCRRLWRRTWKGVKGVVPGRARKTTAPLPADFDDIVVAQ